MATGTERLKIIFDVEGAEQASREVGGLTQSFGSLANKVATGAALIGGAGLIIDQAFELGEEGAQVIQTKESFDTLLESIGAAPDLFDELTMAAGGTISEMDLMSSTATLLAGTSGDLGVELANSSPQLLEIARAANKLNPALGDTTFLFDSIATGIKRNSPLILDNLGLTISLSEAYDSYAASLGKSSDELTVEEQKMALLNAVLEEGDVLIEQVGGNVDSTTDDFARLNASIENITNDLKAGLVPILADAASGLESMLTNGAALIGGLDDLWSSVKDGTTSLSELRDIIINILPSIRDFLEIINPFAGGLGQTIDQAQQAQDAVSGAGGTGYSGGGNTGQP